jgi:hypothetical protein
LNIGRVTSQIGWLEGKQTSDITPAIYIIHRCGTPPVGNKWTFVALHRGQGFQAWKILSRKEDFGADRCTEEMTKKKRQDNDVTNGETQPISASRNKDGSEHLGMLTDRAAATFLVDGHQGASSRPLKSQPSSRENLTRIPAWCR